MGKSSANGGVFMYQFTLSNSKVYCSWCSCMSFFNLPEMAPFLLKITTGPGGAGMAWMKPIVHVPLKPSYGKIGYSVFF